MRWRSKSRLLGSQVMFVAVMAMVVIIVGSVRVAPLWVKRRQEDQRGLWQPAVVGVEGLRITGRSVFAREA